MYDIVFEYNLIEEKHVVTKITHVAKGIDMTRKDFGEKNWKSVKKIANVLDAQIAAKGGPLVQSVRVSSQDLIKGSTSDLINIKLH